MKMEFEYRKAGSVGEAIALLGEAGGEGKILAGGTELLVNIKHHALAPRVVIDIKFIPELNYLTRDSEGALHVGALTTLRTLEAPPEPGPGRTLLAAAARSIATMQVKNVGTIGGNLSQTVKCAYYNQSHVNRFMRESLAPCRQRGGTVCHAVQADTLNHSLAGASSGGCLAPTASDLATPLIALGALVKSRGQRGERLIPAEKFFLGGGRTALGRDEVVVEVKIPALPDTTGGIYRKYAQDVRNFSILNIAGLLWSTPGGECRDLRIVLGGVAVTPLRLRSVEDQARGRPLSSIGREEITATELDGLDVRGDLRAYKMRRAAVLVRDALQDLCKRSMGEWKR